MGRCGKSIIGYLIIFTFLCFSFLHVYAEDLEGESSSDTEEIDMTNEYQIENEVIQGQIIDVQKDILVLQSDVQENNEIIREVYSMQKTEQESSSQNEQIDYTQNFVELHEDNQKIMISLWALFGMLLGSKLIKGMFGNG